MSDPARVVADADVLVADVLVGGESREALDRVREHSWMTMVASEGLLDDAAAAIEAHADEDLDDDWRERIEAAATLVDHPESDHAALACALHGEAGHVLSLDEGLTSARAGAAIRRDAGVETSVKHPDAFARLFDAASLYEAAVGGEYPGPDRDPRV